MTGQKDRTKCEGPRTNRLQDSSELVSLGTSSSQSQLWDPHPYRSGSGPSPPLSPILLWAPSSSGVKALVQTWAVYPEVNDLEAELVSVYFQSTTTCDRWFQIREEERKTDFTLCVRAFCCMYVCVLCACLVLEKVRRCQIS